MPSTPALRTGGEETENIPETQWLANQADSVSCGFNKINLSQKIKVKKEMQCLHLASTCIHTAYIYPHTYKYTYTHLHAHVHTH